MMNKPIGAFTLIALMGITSVVVINTLTIPSASAKPQPNYAVKNQTNQAAELMTEAATITNKWNLDGNSVANKDTSLRVSDPECKKINPLEYLNKPETFFQSCSSTNNFNLQNYEPIEYLKVPRLDSGLSVTVTNF
jgi:Tfp pilus assembly protein PilE